MKQLTPLRTFWTFIDRPVSPLTCLEPKPKAAVRYMFESWLVGYLMSRQLSVLLTVS